MNVLRWCPFVHLFDASFQNSPYDRCSLMWIKLLKYTCNTAHFK